MKSSCNSFFIDWISLKGHFESIYDIYIKLYSIGNKYQLNALINFVFQILIELCWKHQVRSCHRYFTWSHIFLAPIRHSILRCASGFNPGTIILYYFHKWPSINVWLEIYLYVCFQPQILPVAPFHNDIH